MLLRRREYNEDLFLFFKIYCKIVLKFPVAKKKNKKVLHCFVLYCTMLYCTVLTVMFCNILYYIVLRCVVPGVVLYRVALCHGFVLCTQKSTDTYS